MYFLDQPKLKEKYPASLLERVDPYLASLSPTAMGLLNAGKIGCAIGERDFKVLDALLEDCVELGMAKKMYVFRCPHCDHFLHVQETPDLGQWDTGDDMVYCMVCDSTYPKSDVTEDDMRAIYEFAGKS